MNQGRAAAAEKALASQIAPLAQPFDVRLTAVKTRRATTVQAVVEVSGAVISRVRVGVLLADGAGKRCSIHPSRTVRCAGRTSSLTRRRGSARENMPAHRCRNAPFNTFSPGLSFEKAISPRSPKGLGVSGPEGG